VEKERLAAKETDEHAREQKERKKEQVEEEREEREKVKENEGQWKAAEEKKMQARELAKDKQMTTEEKTLEEQAQEALKVKVEEREAKAKAALAVEAANRLRMKMGEEAEDKAAQVQVANKIAQEKKAAAETKQRAHETRKHHGHRKRRERVASGVAGGIVSFLHGQGGILFLLVCIVLQQFRSRSGGMATALHGDVHGYSDIPNSVGADPSLNAIYAGAGENTIHSMQPAPSTPTPTTPSSSSSSSSSAKSLRKLYGQTKVAIRRGLRNNGIEFGSPAGGSDGNGEYYGAGADTTR
jgi:hypothetical protein